MESTKYKLLIQKLVMNSFFFGLGLASPKANRRAAAELPPLQHRALGLSGAKQAEVRSAWSERIGA